MAEQAGATYLLRQIAYFIDQGVIKLDVRGYTDELAQAETALRLAMQMAHDLSTDGSYQLGHGASLYSSHVKENRHG